jgi:hypothetical protein
MTRAPNVAISLLALVVAASVACAGPAVTTERRDDGIFHLKCKTTLEICLAAADNACNHDRYVVLRAYDEHNLKGDTSQPEDFRSSEAFIRCGMRSAWGSENTTLLQQPLCPAAAQASSSAALRVCTPGATQACVGAAGCAGGQACAPDGTSFSTCDCGPSSAPPSPAAAK